MKTDKYTTTSAARRRFLQTTGVAAGAALKEDFQGRGIASGLLRQLVDIARANGIAQFEADVLAGNRPMLAVLSNSGLRMRTSHGQGVVHATLFLTREATHE